MRDRWPVVIGDTVIFRTQPLVHFLHLMQAEDQLFDSLGANPSWPVERGKIIRFLRNHPHYRDFFVLDINSGGRRFIAPVLYNFGNGDIADMPVVNRDTGEVFVRYRFTGGFLNKLGIGEGSTLFYAPAIGRMDLTSNDIAPIDPSNTSDFNWQFRMVSDEGSHLSMGGNMLFVGNWTRVGGIDVVSRELFEVANVMDDWYGCGGLCGAKNGPMPVYDETFPYEPIYAVQGEGRCWQPIVIANGAIYWAIPTIGGQEYQGSALAAVRTVP
jgi:hypothetical protein